MKANLSHCSNLHIHLVDNCFFGFLGFDKGSHRYFPYLCLYCFSELVLIENPGCLIIAIILVLINLVLSSKTQFATTLA